MSNYAHKVILKTVYGGDEIEVQMRPFSFVDFMGIQSRIKDGELAMLQEFHGMMPRYIISIAGARVDGGDEIVADDLLNAYWAGLVSQMMLALVSAASPSDPT